MSTFGDWAQRKEKEPGVTQYLDWFKGKTKETVSLLPMEVEITILADCKTWIPSYIADGLGCVAATDSLWTDNGQVVCKLSLCTDTLPNEEAPSRPALSTSPAQLWSMQLACNCPRNRSPLGHSLVFSPFQEATSCLIPHPWVGRLHA